MDRIDGRGGFAARTLKRVSPPALGLLIVLCCGGIFLMAWSWSKNGGERQEYIGAEARRGDVEDLVTATGALQPRDYVDVGAQVSGQLKKIHVEIGQTVREGELLAEIDAEQSAARVEAGLAQLRSLKAQLEQRRLNLVKAERDLARLRNLLAEEATTLESLQNAETEAADMRAQMAQLRAQIDQLRATTRVEEANLKYTKIYAPMSGTVVSIAAKKGQTLNANQSAPNLMRIADLAVMNVQTQVSEADVSKLRIGMDAYFTTLGGQGRRWRGKLDKIEPTPTVTNNVVLYNALFEVPNENGLLMTQMTAQVFFVVAQARDALLVPMSAIARLAAGTGRQDGPGDDGESARRGSGAGIAGRARAREARVRVIRPGGGIEERQVVIGVSNRIHAEVISGLSPGETVVVGVRAQEKAEAGLEGASNRQPPSSQLRMQPPVPGIPGGAGRAH
ncbi:MAG: efflux RND transporter periplasmic adaptor subunit [Candidatus Accumulibacter sp.]|jgi:macrolide-specific efflux system membrane fusion protein|nr:efflux RND transporter periplasmic adaptor subunit [Accumulibacter sp.]